MMNVPRNRAFYAALPLVLLLQGCPEPMEDGFRQEIDVSQHLPQTSDSLVEQPRSETQVKIGPDSATVTIEWITVRQGLHQAISRISVVFPPHPKTDTFSAAEPSAPRTLGTRDAPMEVLLLKIQRIRNTAGASQSDSVTVVLQGDGESFFF